MKTYRFIGMALFTVLACVNFAACSSDDDEPVSDNGATQKMISSFNWGDLKYNFKYNGNNQLVSVVSLDRNYEINFEWSDSQIIATWSGDTDNPPTYYQLENGIIANINNSDYDVKLTYDADKHLVGVGNKYIWKWMDGNICQYENRLNVNPEFYSYTYYEDKENKHSALDIHSAYIALSLPAASYYLFMAHPSLLGKTNKNLIKTRQWEYHNVAPTNYTYKLDRDGYPLDIKENGNTVYSFTWK